MEERRKRERGSKCSCVQDQVGIGGFVGAPPAVRVRAPFHDFFDNAKSTDNIHPHRALSAGRGESRLDLTHCMHLARLDALLASAAPLVGSMRGNFFPRTLLKE